MLPQARISADSEGRKHPAAPVLQNSSQNPNPRLGSSVSEELLSLECLGGAEAQDELDFALHSLDLGLIYSSELFVSGIFILVALFCAHRFLPSWDFSS